MKSNLIEFYNDSGIPYLISEIPTWNDVEWEQRHDFIQWIFPTTAPSMFNPHSPILTKEDAKELVFNMYFDECIDRFITFLDDTNSLEGESHNCLRVSRCIASCRELGRYNDAKKMFDFAMNRGKDYLSPRTLEFWENANKIKAI